MNDPAPPPEPPRREPQRVGENPFAASSAYEGPAVERPKRISACAWMGACVFFSGFAIAWIVFIAIDQVSNNSPMHHIFYLRGPFVTCSMAAMMGTFLGWDLYRLAVGAREPINVPAAIWILAGVAFCWFGFFVAVIYYHYRRRDELIIRNGQVSWIWSYAYGALFVVGIVDLLIRGPVWGVLVVPFLCDSVLVNLVAIWKQRRELALPESRLQFSLKTLVFLLWGAAAWVTALILVFRAGN